MIEILEEIADNAKAHPSARAVAANSIIDRGFGKAVQTNQTSLTVDKRP